MSDAVDPLEFLDDTSPELEKTLEDPFSVNFRGKEKDLIELYPSHLSFREATVDLANHNVEVKTNVQKDTEGYTTVMYGNGVSLVESQADIMIDSRRHGISTKYYLVTDEETLIYDENGWEEIYNPTPRDVAELTPELYEQAKEYSETGNGLSREIDTTPVPPPEEGEFTK